MDGLGLACKLLLELNESAGRLNDALAAALDGAQATRRLGSPRWSNGFQGIAANFAFRLGRWEEADRLFRALLERRPLPPFVEAYAQLERARLDIARGDVADMRRRLQEAEELVRKASRADFNGVWGPMLAHAQAAFALSEGSYVEAFEAATEGLAARSVPVIRPAGRNCSPSGWPPLQPESSGRAPTMPPPRPKPPPATVQRCSPAWRHWPTALHPPGQNWPPCWSNAEASRHAYTAKPAQPCGPQPQPAGMRSANPTPPPTHGSARPKRYLPAGHCAPRLRPCSERRMPSRSGSGRHRCSGS